MQEAKVSSSSYFITLTYDQDHVHRSHNGFLSLNKRDCQLFFKRLRLENSGNIKYYLAAEYGSETRRPHYHLLLFNSTLESIAPAWGMGSVHYGQVSGASVGYTLKYMMKPTWRPMHRNDDREPQFSLMSKGLGKSYLTEDMIAWHKECLTERMYCVIEDGKKIGMCRYYKEKLYEKSERKLVGMVARKRMLKEYEKLVYEYGPMTERNRAEGVIAAFRKMAIDAEKVGTL